MQPSERNCAELNKPLTVYKASAGSGKTFTLAVEYISLLVSNPDCYKNILAVTFTNKATEEMKIRIIGQLYGIANQLEKSNDYLKKVTEKTGLSEQLVVKRANIALNNLVHNYNYFRVQTIDAFFQSILRNLARELELTPNLRIDLNDRQVVEEAVDELIDNLDQHPKMMRWIRDYIQQNIQDEKSWNVISSIKDFGMNVFRDFYKSHAEELDGLMKNDSFFTEYTRKLRLSRDAAKNNVIGQAEAIIQLLDKHSLNDVSLYPWGSKGGILSTIHKIADGSFDGTPTRQRVQDCMDNPDKWIKKGTGREAEIKELAASHLCQMLKELEDIRLKGWNTYMSAVLTLRHLSQLRLLHAIAEKADQLSKSVNRFQLSNTQSLLHQLMKDCDSPFVFEKIGAQLRHMMIDEFQDTSDIQWNNFRKLLDECMSHPGSQNLIVGDVKQSIYRWRAGDWKLLNDIEDNYSSEQIKLHPLSTNYRSHDKVIRFNNAFFQQAVAIAVEELKSEGIGDYEQLGKAYNTQEVEQKVGPKKAPLHKGYVHISLYPSENYHETVMDNLLQTVDTLRAKGAQCKDIAIIMRNNKEIEEVADMFMRERPDITIISDQAFRLDASLAVTMLVDAFRLLATPDDTVVKARLVKAYNQEVLKNGMTDTQLLIEQELDSGLPAAFIGNKALTTMPILDLADWCYHHFALDKISHQSAYICAFYDMLADYLTDNTADISKFIQDWDEILHIKPIESDENDGIRIISIHKSKGLEYDHVIIPLCDWQLEHNQIIWVEKKSAPPHDQLPIIPVDYTKNQMMGTVYEEDYKKEHLQNTVDNMNLLYVAFTRASKSLIVTGKRQSKNKKGVPSSNRSGIVEQSLPGIADILKGSILTGQNDADAPLEFEWGNLAETLQPSTTDDTDKSKDKNPFTTSPQPLQLQIATYPIPVKFRQSNRSKEFVSGEDEAPTRTTAYIKLGNVLHELFSTIRTIDDVEPRLKELELEGVIYDDELTATELRNKLTTALADPRVQDWFSPKWKLYNECTILTTDSDTSNTNKPQMPRPDRVMYHDGKMIVVDFKFGKPHDKYKEQVQRYMDLLRQMGHQDIEGYLWYVLRGQIDKV